MDLKRWIYSPDLARWLSAGGELDLHERMDCILSAPHRTLEEKLDGLRELRREAEGERQLLDRSGTDPLCRNTREASWRAGRETALKRLDKRIEMGETLDEILHMAGGLRNLYETDLFCYGRKEECVERRIFTLPGPAVDFIREQIRKAADRYEIETNCFFGVLRKFYRRGVRHLELEWNILLNAEGEVLYCLPEKPQEREENDYWIGPGDFSYVKLPYPTGTIVETVESPFFQPVKGIVVNQTEPWEEGFAEEGEQCLLYPDFLHGGNRTGIGVIKLDDYAPITFGADFLLPFRQFLRRCEGGMEKQEMWLAALSDLVREDKRCSIPLPANRRTIWRHRNGCGASIGMWISRCWANIPDTFSKRSRTKDSRFIWRMETKKSSETERWISYPSATI